MKIELYDYNKINKKAIYIKRLCSRTRIKVEINGAEIELRVKYSKIVSGYIIKENIERIVNLYMEINNTFIVEYDKLCYSLTISLSGLKKYETKTKLNNQYEEHFKILNIIIKDIFVKRCSTKKCNNYRHISYSYCKECINKINDMTITQLKKLPKNEDCITLKCLNKSVGCGLCLNHLYNKSLVDIKYKKYALKNNILRECLECCKLTSNEIQCNKCLNKEKRKREPRITKVIEKKSYPTKIESENYRKLLSEDVKKINKEIFNC